MKKKLVLKPFVLPTLYILMVVALMGMSTTLIYKEEEEDLTYVSDSIFDDSVPVLSTEEVYVLKPFDSDKVKIATGYYDYKEEQSKQEQSIIRYDDTYLQNSGVTYEADEVFQVVSIMDGTVTKVYTNDILGNIVEITHDKNMVSVYQMLSEVNVKVNQRVKRGDVIAKSGTSKLSSSQNNLHFELIKDGTIVDPLEYIGKNIKEL